MRPLRRAFFGVGMALTFVVLAMVDGPAEPVKIGVYARALGGQATFKALAKEKDVKAASFKDMKADALLAYDTVVICACTLDQPEQLKALRVFLACGGGLVLNHSSCGRNRPETFFPAVVKKVVDRRVDSILVVKDAKHPIAAGLPEQYEHSYNDHLFLEPGPEGTVVVVDREGAPVVVAGAVGEGRVVFNGSLPGYWYDLATYWQGEREPVGGELQLVLNAAKWSAVRRMTALPADELAKRRKKAEADLKMEDLAKLLPTADWFGQEMLRGSYLPLPPVTELGGRFFITYDSMTWRGYKMKKVENEQQLSSTAAERGRTFFSSNGWA